MASIDELLGLQARQKQQTAEQLRGQAGQQLSRVSSMLGGAGLSPAGTRAGQQFQNLQTGASQNLGRALTQADIGSQQQFLGQERFEAGQALTREQMAQQVAEAQKNRVLQQQLQEQQIQFQEDQQLPDWALALGIGGQALGGLGGLAGGIAKLFP